MWVVESLAQDFLQGLMRQRQAMDPQWQLRLRLFTSRNNPPRAFVSVHLDQHSRTAHMSRWSRDIASKMTGFGRERRLPSRGYCSTNKYAYMYQDGEPSLSRISLCSRFTGWKHQAL